MFVAWRSGDPITPLGAAGMLWILFAVSWLAMSFGRKPARRRENLLERLFHRLYLAAAFILLYASDPRFGSLRHRFLPREPWLEYLGVAVTAAGIAFAIWARRHIGKQWSAEVEIREDHELIATGPYASIRHPIYTGILLAMLGTAIIGGEWRGLVAVALATLGFWIKARKEERFLEQEFGAAYAEHRERTGFFLPRFGPGPRRPREAQSSSSV